MKTSTKSLLLLAMCLLPHLISGQRFGDKATQPATIVLGPTQVHFPTAVDPGQQVLWLEGLIFSCVASASPLNGISPYTRALYACGLTFYEALAPFTKGLKGFLKVPVPGPAKYGRPGRPQLVALSDKLRRPDRSENSKRIAILYATYKVIVTLYPKTSKDFFDGYMAANQLVPDMNDMDTTTPKGIGNTVGAEMLKFLINDGTNQLGDRPGITYNRIPFSDYSSTPYGPVQGCEEKNRDITRWQPIFQWSDTNGQTCQTWLPTWAQVDLLTGKPKQSYLINRPSAILDGPNKPNFMIQVNRIINASAMLDDRMKCTAETVDSKVVEFGRQSIINKYKLNLDQQVMLFFAQFAAIHDGEHLSNFYKGKFDSARPYSIIRNNAGGKLRGNITAWAGPYLGTRSIRPLDWRQFLMVTHASPDVPSGAVADFTTVAVLQKLLLKTSYDPNPSFNWSIICPKGWSQIEPGFSPSQDTFIHIDNAEDLIQWAKNGREWGGIHFLAATNGGEQLGRQLGADLYARFITEFGWSCSSIDLGSGESVFRCSGPTPRPGPKPPS